MTEQICTALASEFPGRLHYKNDDSSFTIWDQKQLETIYLCRVQPESAIEVSRVLQVLVENWCRFAVKCGGHSRFSDDSVSIGGVTIDLGLINNTIVSNDKTTARVGGGSLSRQVFAALDPYGLAYVGGRVGQVGIGGFTLGGGSSVVASQHGWALDNVLEYEVVLPNATIVTASEKTHPDLYYALRGGGNNFGIVTSFNISVFPQGPVYTGSRTFGDNQTGLVLEEAEKIFSIQDYEDTAIGLEYRYTFTQQNGWSISTTQRYVEPVLSPSLITYSIPAAVMKLSKERGGNALGLDAEGGHLVINLFSLSWNDSSMDNTAYSLAEDFIADFQKAAKSLDVFHPFIYINYANKGQDVFASYGRDNQKRLIEVQKAIDPQGVFVSSGLWTGFFKVQ
ncbi:hypothetical protein ACHAPI_007547 [Fusarium lateritium]